MDARLIEALRQSGLLVGVLDPESLYLRVAKLSHGEHLCRRGDPADRLWVIVEGRVVAVSPDRVGPRRAYVPHQVVGERGVLRRMIERVNDLVADDEHTEIIEILARDIESHRDRDVIYRNLAGINSDRVLEAYRDFDRMRDHRDDLLSLLRRYVGEDVLSRRAMIPETFTDCDQQDVVVWFSDLEGFSGLSTRAEPASVAGFVRDALGRQMREIKSRNGFVDKLMGDGIMAYWPIVNNERAVCTQAVEAALAAEEAISAATFLGEPVRFRVGLNRGLVFAGEFGTLERAQYTLIGNVVNKAARLEQVRTEMDASPPRILGSVRLSSEVFGLLPASLQEKFGRAYDCDLKGIGSTRVYSN